MLNKTKLVRMTAIFTILVGALLLGSGCTTANKKPLNTPNQDQQQEQNIKENQNNNQASPNQGGMQR